MYMYVAMAYISYIVIAYLIICHHACVIAKDHHETCYVLIYSIGGSRVIPS